MYGKNHIVSEKLDPEGQHVVTVRCNICCLYIDVAVTFEGLRQWYIERVNVQLVWPEMSRENRELLISGTCSECFDRMFKPQK